MADSYSTKEITDLSTDSSVDDNDLYVVGNAGTSSMRKLTFSSIAEAIKTKLAAWTFSALNTTDKTLTGAINELNSSTYLLTGGKILITANTDLNTLIDVGEYALTQSAQASTIQNKPSGLNVAFRLRAELMTAGDHSYLRQTITTYASSVVYTRHTTNGGSSWTNWETQPTRSEIDALNSNFTHFAIANLGNTGTTNTTINSTDWTQITTGGAIWLAAGKYMFIATINATWENSGFQFYPGLSIANQNVSSLYNYAAAQTNQPVMIMGYIYISTSGTYTIYAIGRVTGTAKQVTIPSYQTMSCMLFYRN